MDSTPDQLSDKTLEMVAERFRVLGDPQRLRILGTLAGGELSVGQIVEALGTAQATVSKQLRVLLRAGLVSRRKDGLFVYYTVNDPQVFRLCDAVCGSLTQQLRENLQALQGAAASPRGAPPRPRSTAATRARPRRNRRG